MIVFFILLEEVLQMRESRYFAPTQLFDYLSDCAFIVIEVSGFLQGRFLSLLIHSSWSLDMLER